MDRLRYFWIAVFLMAQFPLAIAQKSAIHDDKASTRTSAETLFVHANTTTLVTGETLYCKVYCLDPSNQLPSNISRIVYAELIDSDKKSVSRQKLHLEDGKAQGDIFIPTTLKTGVYKLIAYTQWMLSASAANFFEMDLCVINPFQPLEKNTLTTDHVIPVAAEKIQNPTTNLLSLSTDKKSYGLREKVRLQINNPNGSKGNYSVSVRKLDALPAKKQPDATILPTAVNFPDQPKAGLFPELRGEIISGKVISKQDKKTAHKTVALSIPGKSFAFKIVKSDASGRFQFLLDKEPETSSAVIQVMEDDRADFGIELDAPHQADLSRLRFEQLPSLSADLKTAIETRSVASQIQNAYYETKKDSLETAGLTESFFHPVEKRYVLDDFTRFPTMRETITEVVLEMFTRKDGNKSSIHLRNNTMDPEFYGQALVLVDGLLIQDTDELYQYNPENIYAIDLINHPYVYGPRTFSGVANIVTKNFDYETKASGDFFRKVNLVRPSVHKKYSSPSYDAGHSLDHVPDYRLQLLWQPQVVVDKSAVTIPFFTSDVSGKYEIILQGFTQNGEAVWLSDHIEVK